MATDLCSGEPLDVANTVEHKLSLNDLPDEILVLIFNRLLDLKCLCLCSLVSPRFSSLILLHVHSVSFVVPCPTPSSNTLSKKLRRFFRRFAFVTASKPCPPSFSCFYSASFRSAGYFLSKFKSIRSFHLILPSYTHKLKHDLNDSFFLKWTVKFGPTIDTLVFLFASSIKAGNVDQEEEEEEEDSALTTYKLRQHRLGLAYRYVHDALVRHWMLLFLIEEHPLLQDITITDSMNQGNLSLRGSTLTEMRDWIKSELKKTDAHVDSSLRDSKLAEKRKWFNSARLKIKLALNKFEYPVRVEEWHVPMLELPVSGKVMKNATLVLMELVDRSHLHKDLGGDAAAIANFFGKGEEIFGEAIVEMMVNHQSRIII